MLTQEQKIERRKGLGGSDASKIMSGDWYALWLDKTGREEPPEILSPWDAAVRHALEPLVMDQYELDYGHEVIRRGEAVICEKYPILRCTLDGYDFVLQKPVDAKALNIWTKEPEQWCIEHYTGQMQHQMICTDAKISSLYVSLGMKKPFEIPFTFDAFAANEYIGACQEFWGHVERDEPPTQGAVVDAPPPPKELMRVVDMSGSNAWGFAAADWLANGKAAKLYEAAQKDLKSMVEPDVREASGFGVKITRSKAGSLLIKGVT